MAAKFTVFIDKSKRYRFNLKAVNGEIIAASEAYETKAAALKGIASIQKSAPTAKIIDDTGETAVKAAKTPAASKKASAAAPAKRGRKPKA
jgi:uncharacterized protein YegP (UPF0339 family)